MICKVNLQNLPAKSGRKISSAQHVEMALWAASEAAISNWVDWTAAGAWETCNEPSASVAGKGKEEDKDETHCRERKEKTRVTR